MRVSIFMCLFLAAASLFAYVNPALVGLADNTVMDLGVFQCGAVEGESSADCRKMTDFSGFAYDRARQQIVIFGGGHATTFTDAIEAFSFQTLAWHSLYTPTPCSYLTAGNADGTKGAWLSGPSGPYPRPYARHTYDEMAVPDNTGELVLLAPPNSCGSCASCSAPLTGQGRVAHYSFQDNTWSFSATAPCDGFLSYSMLTYPSAEYDPVSGKIIQLATWGLYVYDPVTKIETCPVDAYRTDFKDSTGAKTNGLPGGWCHMVYYPPNRRFYYFDRSFSPLRVYELALNRADFSQSTLTPIAFTGTPPSGEKGYDYDAVNQVIGGGISNSTFYAFNPKTRAWDSRTMQGGSPGAMAFHAIAYDSANNVFIFTDDDPFGKHTWAYRYKKATGNGIVARPSAGLAPNPLTVSPNPLRALAVVSAGNRDADIAVFDLGGKNVASFACAGGGPAVWKTEGLPAGIYIIKAKTGADVFTRPAFVVR